MSEHNWMRIETAPRDGTFLRLRSRASPLYPHGYQTQGRWEPHEEMPAGGAWFDADGNYVSPYPIAWAPIQVH